MREEITGVILAGGLATRMGGVDKGLQVWHGRPLAEHVLRRLHPQVGTVAINANRHLDRYRALGVPVWPDEKDDRPGPLAGMLTALRRSSTAWTTTVPCDAPRLAEDLVNRLVRALSAEPGARLAVAALRDAQGRIHPEPVFCLMHTSLQAHLATHLAAGTRKVGHWTREAQALVVPFEDVAAFTNVNTLDDLSRLRP